MAHREQSIEHKFADVNAIRLHYVSAGQGKLMLFLHGFPEFWAEWEAQLSAFGTDYHVVAPDLRGFNLSSKPVHPRDYHIKILVEDLRALAEHLGHTKMILIAHDWGGGVAWAFAHRHPEYVEKLIIVNSPHPVVFARELLRNPMQQNASAYMNLFRGSKAESILTQNHYAYLLEALTGSGSRWRMTDVLRKRYLAAWSQPGALTGGLNYYRASPLHPATSESEVAVLRQIANAPPEMFTVSVPTLVIWGELDIALLSGNLEGLSDYVAPLTIERIPDGTHWVVHEQPERVTSCIRAFIEP